MQKFIELKNVSYQIPYGATILEGINLEIEAGKFLGILGHNGAGKTTLMDLLMGFRKSTRGECLVLGEDPFLDQRKHRQDVAFLSQDVTLKGSITIEDYLSFHAGLYPNYCVESEAKLLKSFKLDVSAKIGSLSTGQQKKVHIVASLASMPKIIFIDEITAVLDPETRNLFFDHIQSFRKENHCAVILATNIAEDLVDRVDEIFFIDHGHGKVHTPDEISKLFNLKEQVA